MIDTVVFDIGMVLMGWHPELTGYFDFSEETIKRVRASIFESGLWAETDLGVRDDFEVFDDMKAYDPEVSDEIDYVLKNLSNIAEDYDYPISWINELKKKGLKVYYLSNYPKYLKERFPEALYFIPYMDGGIFSSDIKKVKPGSDIYLSLIDQYHLTPESCLFIDDKLENVLGAEKVKMHGYHFKSYKEDYEKIMNLIETL